jgi:hypothetical protein
VSRWRHATQALRHRQAVLVTGGEDPMGNAVFDPQVLDTSGGAAGPVAPSRSRARSACVFARDLAILLKDRHAVFVCIPARRGWGTWHH